MLTSIMKKNIIIIGSTGAIGKSFVDHFSSQDSSNSIYSLSRKKEGHQDNNITFVPIDIEDEASIYNSSKVCSEKGPFDTIIVCTGLLHSDNLKPEKSVRDLNKESLLKVLSVNTIGPTLIGKYFTPLLRKDSPSILSYLSARVGSISDNKLGGWYSYRASKAALNMIIKTLSIEVARNNKNAVIVGLHPGTVDSNLSTPFQANVPDGKLFTPQYSVSKMVEVMNTLTPSDSGNCFAWDGERIEF